MPSRVLGEGEAVCQTGQTRTKSASKGGGRVGSKRSKHSVLLNAEQISREKERPLAISIACTPSHRG